MNGDPAATGEAPEWSVPKTRPLGIIRIDIDEPQLLGPTPRGDRRIIPLLGGSVEGRLSGRVLPGGADWAAIRPDGVFELNVRLTIETDDGALIYMSYEGMRHGSEEDVAALNRGEYVPPERYYFRVLPRFETSAPRWSWLNRIFCVGYGERLTTGPRYHLHEIL